MATALNRPLVLAYNGVAVSGDDAAFQLGGYSFDKGSDGKVNLGFDVLVVGSSATDLQSKLLALDALRGEDGDLSVQLGRELEVDALVADGTTTVTSATGGFLAAHVGLWLSIRGIGTRKISARNSATSVTLTAAVTTGSYRAFLPAKLFAGTHAANTFTGGRGKVSKRAGTEGNTEFSQVLSVTVDGTADAKGPLATANVRVTWDSARRRTAVLSGTFVPYDYDADGDVDSAKAVYDHYVSTFVTNHLSAFGGASAYELTSQTEGYPADDDVTTYASGALPAKRYEWSRTYLERFVADAVGVIDQALTVTFTQNTTHGLKGLAGKVTARVSYGAAIDHDVVVNTGLPAYYRSTIRPLIEAAIKLYGATTKVVIESESPEFGQSGNHLAATWSVVLSALSSRILAYSETEAQSDDDGARITELWDAKDYTHQRSPTGASRTRRVNVNATSQTPITFSPTSGELVGGTDGSGGSGGDEVMGIGIPSAGGAVVTYPKKKGETAAAVGAWVLNGVQEIGHDKQEVGFSIWGSLDRMTLYHATCVRSYIWEIPAADGKPAFLGEDAPAVELTTGEP